MTKMAKTPYSTSRRGNNVSTPANYRVGYKAVTSSRSTPNDKTVAETPSPNGFGIGDTPDTLRVKIVDSPPATTKRGNRKPFDESPEAPHISPFDERKAEDDDAENQPSFDGDGRSTGSSCHYKSTSRMLRLSKIMQDMSALDRLARAEHASSESDSEGSAVGLPAPKEPPITVMSPLAAEIAAAASVQEISSFMPREIAKAPRVPAVITMTTTTPLPAKEHSTTNKTFPSTKKNLNASSKVQQMITAINTMSQAPATPSYLRPGMLPSKSPIQLDEKKFSWMDKAPAVASAVPPSIPSSHEEVEYRIGATPRIESSAFMSNNGGANLTRESRRTAVPDVTDIPSTTAHFSFVDKRAAVTSAVKPSIPSSQHEEVEYRIGATPRVEPAVVMSDNGGISLTQESPRTADPDVTVTPSPTVDASNGFIKPDSLNAFAKPESPSSSSKSTSKSSIEEEKKLPAQEEKVLLVKEKDDDSVSIYKTPEDEPGHIVPTPKWLAADDHESNGSEGSDIPFDCVYDFSSYCNGDVSRIQDMADEEELIDIEIGATTPAKSKKSKRTKKEGRRLFYNTVAAASNGFRSRGTGRSLKEHQARSELAPPPEDGPNFANEVKDSNRPEVPLNVIEVKINMKKKNKDSFEDEPLASVALASNNKRSMVGPDMSFDGLDKSFVDTPRFPGRGPSLSPQKRKKTTVTETVVAGRHWACTALYIVILLVLIVSAVGVGLYFTGHLPTFWIPDDGDASGLNSTAAGNSTGQGSDLFEGSESVACGDAEPLLEMNRPYYGSTWKSFWDEAVDRCGDEMSTGYAVWYSYETNSSQLVEASTCGEADFDTQITVLSGTCESLTCVSFNDQACGDQSSVTFYAEAGTKYYVVVHGYREASGTFALTMKEAVHHDSCAKAMGPILPRSVTSGTTAGAKQSNAPPQCGDIDTSIPGVWYEVGNVTGFYRLEILKGYTSFQGQITVYRSMDEADGGCSSLLCDQGSPTGNVTWLAESKVKYYVYVNGRDGTSGAFDLFFGPNVESSCNDAAALDANTIGYLGSTRVANPQNVESCGYSGYHTAPGLWFSVLGTGEILEVSTCGSVDDLDTQISVFENGCDSLTCIGGTGADVPCGPNGTISWLTEPGTPYHIFVSGHSSRIGEFILNINEVSSINGYSCSSSLPLDSGNTSFTSTTDNAPAQSIDTCVDYGAVRGVWHKFVGTGNKMNISVCNNATDFDARLSLYTGSCEDEQRKCVAHTSSRCGLHSDMLLTTHVGETYYLFVHGTDAVSVGNYRLTITESVINDRCRAAPSLDVTPGKYFGSTLSAELSTSIECAGSDGESVGLWYRFVGTGAMITFSTCSEQTDFNTDITVFSGSCASLRCVANTHNTCGQQSSVAFETNGNETYYVRIGGNSTEDVGNFVMDVRDVSPFFQN